MKLFGTDGIRGKAGEYPLNAAAIRAIGQSIGEKLNGAILIGQDTRVSSPWILELLKEGFRRTSSTVHDAGVIPTPAIALLTRENEYAGGLMISASHNPFEDNGIKVFSSDGAKLKDADEEEIEKRILALNAATTPDDIPDVLVSANNASSWPSRYLELLRSHFKPGPWLEGKTVVVDCANGAMSQVAPSALKELGATVRVLHATPTGKNINLNCGAVHLESLTTAMKNTQADFGVAFDGDGDRSLFVSAKGRQIDGDAVLLLMARRLRPNVVVGTSMTNYALEKKLESEGILLKRVNVGDRFIFEEMRQSERAIGGEPSGHIIFSDFKLSGDGLLTTLKLAEAMVEARTSLDELTRDWVPAPQLLKGVRVSQRVPLEKLTGLGACIYEAEEALRGRGRLVVRYSGTEPLLRVMIESDDASRNELWMGKLLAAIERDFSEGLRG